MIEKIARVGILGFLAIAVVLTACGVVVYSVVYGTETDTTKQFATALAGPGLGAILVAIGAAFGGSKPSA